MKKKSIAVILCGILSLSAVGGCESAPSPSPLHTHVYGEWVTTTKPSCKSDGEQTKTCACGDAQTQPLNRVAHSYGEDNKCIWCDTEFHTHVYGEWEVVLETTCQRGGIKEKSCACGEKVEQPLGRVNHSYGVDNKCIWCETVDVNAPSIKLSKYEGKEVDILHPTLRSSIDQRADYDALATLLKAEATAAKFLMKQNLTFSWSKTGSVALPYTISFSQNENFQNAFTHELHETSTTEIGFFIPGVTYFWRVQGADGTVSDVDTFTVKDAPVRAITAGTMKNVRDIGGWTTESGQKIPYGKLYRGDDANFPSVNPEANGNEMTHKVFNYLGINGEIDLRFDSKMTQNALDEKKPFLKAGMKYFSQNIPNTAPANYVQENGDYPMSVSVLTANIGKIFKFLADESNYPVYTHCSWGKDRTGTIFYLISGLLGVKYDDLMCDYELSSFGKDITTNKRNEIISDGAGGWKFQDAEKDVWGEVGRMHYDIIQLYPSNSTSESIARFLKESCGVTQAEINAFKTIMLGNAS